MNFNILKNSLLEKGYAVSVFSTAADAAAYLDSQITGKSVGFGGSMTLLEMGVFERLSAHNNVYWHWRIPEGKSSAEVCAAASHAQVYISSVNAIAATGEIVNIDGNCNRVSAIVYGHEKVYLVVGINKIADDFESALYRARNVAAPMNAKRLSRNTPCAAKADHCYNCKSPERICRNLSVLWEKPTSCAFELLLIKESLGY